ncbi:hypothetical protein GC163_19645 [bacterium]|nr:hypothetical protein [bacterium]
MLRFICIFSLFIVAVWPCHCLGQQSASPCDVAAGMDDATDGLNFIQASGIGIFCSEGRDKLVRIVAVDPAGPGANASLKSVSNRDLKIAPGMIVKSFNKIQVNSHAHFLELTRIYRNEVELEAIEPKSKTEYVWSIQPLRMRVATMVAKKESRNASCHILLAAQTNDNKIGEMVDGTRRDYSELIDICVTKPRIASICILDGNRCSIEGFRDAIDSLVVLPQDSIFMIYLGHGSYDESLLSSDSGGGHFFRLCDGDQLRSQLLSKLLSKQPRAVVLISDCCNDKDLLRPSVKRYMEVKQVQIEEWAPLEELLLGCEGVFDATSCSPGQYSFYDPVRGGWFSSVLISSIEAGDRDTKDVMHSWGMMWPAITTATQQTYLESRQLEMRNLGNPEKVRAQLRSQGEMTPLVFRNEMKSIAIPEQAPPSRVMVKSTYSLREEP